MRYFRIFLLHFQQVFENRGRSFVFFLLSFLNPMLLLTFWYGAYKSHGEVLEGWQFSSVASYYLLLIVAGAFLIVHVEEDVAVLQIQEGGLVKYLIKPFSFFWSIFIEEIPWRIIQGMFGIVALLSLSFFFGIVIQLSNNIFTLFFAICIAICGYFISFLFKMIVGFSAFWVTDYRGLQQFIEVMILIFAGFIMPISAYPHIVQTIANILPFSYMIYYPILAFQGKLEIVRMIQILVIQGIWIAAFVGIYKLMWQNGLKKFTAVGQ